MASLTLSRRDIARFESASAAFHEFDPDGDLSSWGDHVLAEARAFVGATKGAISLGHGSRVQATTQNLDSRVIDEYRAYYHRFDFGRAAGSARQPVAGATGTATLYAGRMQEYLRSEYYNDYHRPFGMFGGVALLAREAPEPTLYLWFDRQRSIDQDSRAVSMLRLLYPALAAGVRRWSRLAHLTPVIIARLEDSTRTRQRVRAAAGEALTRRERQVAELLACRWSNAEIARHLGVSEHTARHHTEHVLRKLGVGTRREVSRGLRRDA